MPLDRPLLGEPLGLDLLNTEWAGRTGPADLLADLAGTRQWLREADLADQPATEPVRQALRTARDAIRAHAEHATGHAIRGHAEQATRDALNAVLAWGRHWPVLTEHGPDTATELADPARRAGWLAALNYVDLLVKDADRIRRCAHPDCVLYFYDTSPKRGRRWCSMAGCGNRAKAARHYARTRRAP